ncbi:hypothetical protein F9U64_15370 [Gracilibacillus oryzae]|uniref:Uncharacterized protein n=1 Tax=Gracilibacillus oryzae TaxID=1672701 RepID=A0A7C8KNT7_9BACI|nr:hypothetical protein [Gracilibacillus oryzae]KAB8129164.1 hypothetical protein F9U64_15370 [Gracilibacillus oryzae]
MKKFLTILGIMLFLTACGTSENTPAIDQEEAYQFHHQEDGMELTAEITVGETIKVSAALENVSDQPIIYNGRCGIPFQIFVQMNGSNATLQNKKQTAPKECTDIFDPNDLEEFAAGETIEKNVSYIRKFSLHGENLQAHNGEYKIHFFFHSHDGDNITADYPFTLINQDEPDILTIEQAKAMALEYEKTAEWYEKQQEKGLTIKAEEAILSSSGWHLPFQAMDDTFVHRVIVGVNYESGKIVDYHTEKIERKYWEDATSTTQD